MNNEDKVREKIGALQDAEDSVRDRQQQLQTAVQLCDTRRKELIKTLKALGSRPVLYAGYIFSVIDGATGGDDLTQEKFDGVVISCPKPTKKSAKP